MEILYNEKAMMPAESTYESEIRRVVFDWLTACVNGDTDSAMRCIADEDAVCFLPGIEGHVVASDIPAALSIQPIKHANTSVHLTWLDIDIHDDFAIAALEAVLLITENASDAQPVIRGTVILQNREGMWLILQSHLSFTNAEGAKSSSGFRISDFIDPVTSLYNRQFFELEARRLDTKRQLPLSIIVADIDALKMINDVFGHQEGDRFLAHIGRIIKEACRKEDIGARWGGDEFAILLPQTPNSAAEMICRRIEITCRNNTFNEFAPSLSLGFASKLTESTSFAEVFIEAENMMYKNKLTSGKNIRQNLMAIMRSHLARETHETTAHCRRLKRIACLMGQCLQLSPRELEALSSLSMIHDIGQIAVGDSVLLKPDALTESEWTAIRRHPEIGYRIAMSVPSSTSAADFVLSHHEHWDGTGYPLGISGEDIPFMSRLFSVADAYDSMTNDRPYRKALPPECAIAEICRCSGSQFDPAMVEVFVRTHTLGR